MSEICTGCQEPLDLSTPHVKFVRNVEQEDRAEVTVTDSVVVSMWHVEHAPGSEVAR